MKHLLLLSAISAVNLHAATWPQFRGPEGNGHSEATGVPTTWSESDNIAWKTAIPGKGWSSPVVSGGLVWITTAIEETYTPEEEKTILEGIDAKKADQRQLAKGVALKAICLDLASGEKIRTVDLHTVNEPDYIHSLNSYASPTPVLDEDRLYCHFGTYGTFCIDTASGKELWRKTFPLEHSVGPGSSPFLLGDLLVLVCDGVDVQYVIALDKMTGETVWQTDRPPMRAETGDQKKAYSTPIAITDGVGAVQVIIPTSQWLISYDPKTGKENWRVDHGKGFSLVPRPVYGHGMVYFATGFSSNELWAVKVDGKGDVSDTHVAWKATRQIPSKPSPLLIGDRLYIISDSGITTCLDAHTGEDKWIERITGNYSASPTLAETKIYFASHEGVTTIIEPGDEYKEIAKNVIEGQIMATPVPLDGALLLRTDTALYRVSRIGVGTAH